MTACILCGCSGHVDSDSPSPAVGCGQSQKGDCIPCTILEEVNVKIAETKTFLDSLIHERNGLKSNMNRAHDPFHLLPPELASHICMLSTGEDQKHRPFILCAVNQQWRAIASSTPQLWNNITIHLTPATFKRQFSRIEIYIARSGSLPLSICIKPHSSRFLTREKEERLHLLDPVWLAISAHSERWESVIMEIPLCILPRLQGFARSSSKLRHLDISIIGSRDAAAEDIFEIWEVPPSPFTISIVNLPLNSLRINWNNATEVTVFELTEDECLKIFRQASRMKSCCITLCNGDVDHPEATVVHPCLQKLELSSGDFNTVGITPTLFHRLVLPSLEDISFRVDPIDREFIRSFLVHSSCRLSRLSIDFANCYPDDDFDIISLLRLAPAIKELELWNFLLEDNDPVIKLLAKTSAIPDDADLVSAFLPHLTSLAYHEEIQHHWPSIHALFPPMQKAPNIRYRPFTKLELYIKVENYGDEDYIDQQTLPLLLDLIINRGFNLKILDSQGKDVIRGSQLHYEDADKETDADDQL